MMTARELAHVGGRPWCNDATGKHAPECDEQTAAIERDRAEHAGEGAAGVAHLRDWTARAIELLRKFNRGRA